MKEGVRVGLAVAAGYYLGRRHKLRAAASLGTAMLLGRLRGRQGELVRQGLKALGSSPELDELTNRVRNDLMQVGKAAAMAATSRQIDSLSNKLHERAEAIRVPGARQAAEAAGTVKDTATDTAGTAKDTATDTAGTAKDTAERTAGTVRDTATDTVKDTAKGPLKADTLKDTAATALGRQSRQGRESGEPEGEEEQQVPRPRVTRRPVTVRRRPSSRGGD
ncbi:hypothetical protein HNP84_008368 [Thermocatellispora tengchongensis]|uniref:DNA primase n=1 Tax=Thermocatellispora tengchongensis TaxID=1073253 RepID=A0A840PB38_9ACTN|nr:hypothetical protein [Thermocatellispora tengchongensis]